jgi:protein gp37
MSKSQIEWTDTTWNPVVGCSIMSAGCKNCYAMNMAKRLEAMGVSKYEGLTRTSGNRTIWNNTVRVDRTALTLPFKWRKRRTVFVNSMSDLFHPAISIEFVREIWDVMKQTPQHSYQILTKRPDRLLSAFESHKLTELSNVWLGTSVEDSRVVDRIDVLRKVPSEVRFISFEPLIGSVGSLDLTGIHWAIVGGESGSHARPIRELWIDEIHNACRTYDTAFFFKQWGTWGADNVKRSKKANGREYRGRVWDEMPISAE